jgi:hypothetical protein
MTTFFLPLAVNTHWNNNETKYLLRSLEENFLDPFEVVSYYQEMPKLKIKGKHMNRYYPTKAFNFYKGVKNYENYFDTCNKILQFIYSRYCPESFIFCYDDILLLKKITSKDILNCPQYKMTEKSYFYNNKTKWGKTINEAIKLSNGTFNFEHHLPMIYKRDLLKEMFNKFPLQEQLVPYALGTLYFNLFPQEASNATLNDLPNYKCGFEGIGGMLNRQCVYPQNTTKEINKAVNGKTFCNYNDSGLEWKPPEFPLKKWIEETFTKKSKYEY